MSAPAYSQVTDQILLSQIQAILIEAPNGGISLTTTQFTVAQLTNAVDQAQHDFLRDTGLVFWHVGYGGDSNTGIATVPGVESFPLPQDTQDVRRMAWIGQQGSLYGLGAYGAGFYSMIYSEVMDLPAQDSLVSDGINPPWESQTGVPATQDETLPAIPASYLNPAPNNVGQIDITYVPVPTPLSNTGVPLSVPPDFAPAVLYRALAILFGTQGEGNDTARERLCQGHYELWVQLARAVVQMPGLLQVAA